MDCDNSPSTPRECLAGRQYEKSHFIDGGDHARDDQCCHRRSLSGTWQGTIKNQHVLKLTKKPRGGYRGEWFNLGQEQEGTLNGNPISSVDFDGSHLKFTPGLKSNYYEGDLSA